MQASAAVRVEDTPEGIPNPHRAESPVADGKREAKREDPEENPNYLCPITQASMVDPVIPISVDEATGRLETNGHSFERAAIHEEFRRTGVHPLTHRRLTGIFLSNLGLRSVIHGDRAQPLPAVAPVYVTPLLDRDREPYLLVGFRSRRHYFQDSRVAVAESKEIATPLGLGLSALGFNCLVAIVFPTILYEAKHNVISQLPGLIFLMGLLGGVAGFIPVIYIADKNLERPIAERKPITCGSMSRYFINTAVAGTAGATITYFLSYPGSHLSESAASGVGYASAGMVMSFVYGGFEPIKVVGKSMMRAASYIASGLFGRCRRPRPQPNHGVLAAPLVELPQP